MLLCHDVYFQQIIYLIHDSADFNYMYNVPFHSHGTQRIFAYSSYESTHTKVWNIFKPYINAISWNYLEMRCIVLYTIAKRVQTSCFTMLPHL